VAETSEFHVRRLRPRDNQEATGRPNGWYRINGGGRGSSTATASGRGTHARRAVSPRLVIIMSPRR